MSASDSSRPPPTDPRATIHDAAETLEQRVSRHRADAKETRADLVALTDRVESLETLVGEPPGAFGDARGSGLSQHLVDLTVAVKSLRETVEADRKERADEAERAAKRREPWSRATWLLVAALVSAVVGGASSAVGQWVRPRPSIEAPAR